MPAWTCVTPGPGACWPGPPPGHGRRGTMFDHPLLRLEVGGRHAYLEPDLIAFQVHGRFHVIEIKSFAVIDGRADGDKVAAAAIQSAVYVLALRDALAELGISPSRRRRRDDPGLPARTSPTVPSPSHSTSASSSPCCAGNSPGSTGSMTSWPAARRSDLRP